MQYDVAMTPAQLEALSEWAEPSGADILIVREGDNLVVGQGDDRVRISPAGDTVDHPEPARELTTGDRLARLAQELLNPDYDPAAEDEDGVPIFSDETAGRPTDDPRYRTGAH